MYSIKLSNRYKKDLKFFGNNTKVLKELYEIIKLLTSGNSLPMKYRDHKLSGKRDGCRECHVFPDILLIYKREEKELSLYLLRLDSHSSLF